MNINIKEINACLRQDAAELIRQSDKSISSQISKIADFICNTRTERPVILLSGPSGSGKTTTAKMLADMLDNRGYKTHTLSMDNYFKPLDPAEKHVDLESPERVDTLLLNTQLDAIENGLPVELPEFDFSSNTRRTNAKPFIRKPGELVILEGIHALNPQVITLQEHTTTRLYVSVRTRVTAGDMVLHPKKIRLLRRMERDKLFRGRKISQTLQMFESVQRGENRYIMPFKPRSMFDVDTFVPYEISAYRGTLLPELQVLAGGQIDDLVRIVSKAEPLNLSKIPNESLIREFIGGSRYY